MRKSFTYILTCNHSNNIDEQIKTQHNQLVITVILYLAINLQSQEGSCRNVRDSLKVFADPEAR